MTTLETSGQSFEIGRVISAAVGAIQRNFVVFAALSLLLAGLPAFATAYFQMGVLEGGADPVQGGSGMGLTAMVGAVSSLVLQGALIHGVVADLNGRRADFAAAFSVGLRNLLPILAISILMTIGLFFGFLLLIVPGVIFYLMWIVAVPAAVVERAGVFGAFTRSAFLTKGRRWAILGLFLLVVVLSVLVSAALGVVLGVAGLAGALIANPVASTLTGMIGAAVIGALYFELRRSKEGVSAEALASVFD